MTLKSIRIVTSPTSVQHCEVKKVADQSYNLHAVESSIPTVTQQRSVLASTMLFSHVSLAVLLAAIPGKLVLFLDIGIRHSNSQHQGPSHLLSQPNPSSRRASGLAHQAVNAAMAQRVASIPATGPRAQMPKCVKM